MPVHSSTQKRDVTNVRFLHNSTTCRKNEIYDVKLQNLMLNAVPTPIDGFNTDSARPRSTTSGEASLVWEDGDEMCTKHVCQFCLTI